MFVATGVVLASLSAFAQEQARPGGSPAAVDLAASSAEPELPEHLQTRRKILYSSLTFATLMSLAAWGTRRSSGGRFFTMLAGAHGLSIASGLALLEGMDTNQGPAIEVLAAGGGLVVGAIVGGVVGYYAGGPEKARLPVTLGGGLLAVVPLALWTF